MGILIFQALLPQGGSLWVGIIQLACAITLGLTQHREITRLLKMLKKA